MATLNDITENAPYWEDGTLNLKFLKDVGTPEGHFEVFTAVDSVSLAYLLSGEEGDPNARIVGRVEMTISSGTIHTSAYAGEGLGGGTLLGTDLTYEESYRLILTADA